jgi:hypothetical protein
MLKTIGGLVTLITEMMIGHLHSGIKPMEEW